MQKRFSVLLALTLMGLLIFPVRAQEALTQTVTAPDGSYSLMYPAGWSVAFETGGNNIIISSPDKSVIGNAAFEGNTRTAKEQADTYTTGSNVTDTNISIKEFQVNGLPAARAQFKAGEHTEEIITVEYPNKKLFRIAVYEETPDAIANAGATLLAMASSFKVETAAAPTTAPSDSSAQGTAQELTQTITASDGSYSFMSPAGWQWVPTPPNSVNLSGTGDADSLIGQIIVTPKVASMTVDAAAKALIPAPKTSEISGQTITYGDVPGGIAAVVALSDQQVILGFFQGSDAVIKKQEATLLAIMASIKSGTAAASASDAATPVESSTEAVTAPVVPDLGEGAILAIVDGQGGGSTGLGDELYEFNIDTKTGKSLKQFDTSASQFNNVAWSPDGSQLAFYAINPGGLMITDVNGGNPLVLQGASFVFAWAPDGKHITTTGHNGDDWMVNFLGLDGERSDFSLTLKNMQYVDFLHWSPDGKWLAYIGTPSDNNDNQDALHIIDATGNNDQLIVPAGDIAHNVMWSPDSTQLAYIDKDNLTTFDIATKATKVIAKQVLAADWSPDGKQFVYTNRNAQWFVANADGTKPKEIALPADLKGQIVSIAWRPGTSSAATPAEAATPTASATSTTSTTGTEAVSTCTVSTASGANLRSGPGTSFSRAGSLAAGTSQTVTGQAKSSDNFVWWKLESGSWVRSDVVQTVGDCSTVPTVAP